MSDDAKHEAEVVPLRRAGRGACPMCGKPAAEKYRPFCSRRCADLDLGKWLNGSYRVPTEEPAPEGAGPGDDEA
ncbi:DNA gyrase inhibitor YacG [Ferruginivarius sediminum]|uniref:DNA gyrase inhibitor YacG n=1 Tax=Ferruginivarius sediminum TaxID=2661937 RepID=A0A369TE18_9PROT|nr:DNA gyrase inhibitor YacG [Ferruginivarius sediminum]